MAAEALGLVKGQAHDLAGALLDDVWGHELLGQLHAHAHEGGEQAHETFGSRAHVCHRQGLGVDIGPICEGGLARMINGLDVVDQLALRGMGAAGVPFAAQALNVRVARGRVLVRHWARGQGGRMGDPDLLQPRHLRPVFRGVEAWDASVCSCEPRARCLPPPPQAR